MIALETNICNLTEFCPDDLVCNPRLPNCGAMGPHGSDQYSVSMLFLLQNKFNVFDIGSQLQCLSKRGLDHLGPLIPSS